MTQRATTILAVDDDPVNLEIIEESLADLDYRIVTAADGEQAWALLREDPDRFDAVLLDRMMPKMNGMALLALMKADPAFKPIPVILQTAAASTAEVHEGLSAGAYYYLTKPHEKSILLAIVRTAIQDHAIRRHMRRETLAVSHAFTLLSAGRFHFRTLEEVKSLATLIASVFPDPEQVGIGIYELMLNAVEHGNLGISYQEKSQLLATASWEEDVARRLAMPEYAARVATVEFDREPGSILLVIKDQGEGFDWRPFMEFSVERAYDAHGRGIATAHQMCFTSLEYRGKGNEVIVTLACPERTEPDPSST
jgi:CheY-like chemotaxis protein/anti-sigma regulatory factor (Ser/Thr protein kinase)